MLGGGVEQVTAEQGSPTQASPLQPFAHATSRGAYWQLPAAQLPTGA